jgi:WD40 repeat protein
MTTTTTNGYYLVAGTVSGEVMVWDAECGSLLSVFKAHTQKVTALALSDDSLWLATGGSDALIRVWSLPLVISATARETANLLTPSSDCCWATFSAHSLPVTTLRWIDLSLLISGSLDQTLRVWDVHSQRALLTVTFQTPLRCVTLSPNHDTLFIGAADGRIYVLSLWNLPSTDFTASSHTQPLMGHTAPLTTLCTSFDGSILVSGSEDATLRLWDTCTFQLLQTITRHKSSVVSAHFLVVSPLHATATPTSFSPPRPLARWSTFDSTTTTDSQQLSPLIFSDVNTELVHSLWQQTHSSLALVHCRGHNPTSYRPSSTTVRCVSSLTIYRFPLRKQLCFLSFVMYLTFAYTTTDGEQEPRQSPIGEYSVEGENASIRRSNHSMEEVRQ